MRKSKGQTVDLLYVNNKEVNKKEKIKQKNAPKKKKNNIKKTQNNNERINLNNEIIIGLTPKPTQTKKKQNRIHTQKTRKKSIGDNSNRPRKKNNVNKNKKIAKNIGTTNKNVRKEKTKKQNSKKRINLKVVKWIIIVILIIVSVILFMTSSIFNIKQIVVINNSKISSSDVIALSELTPGMNMFKTTKGKIIDKIKANAYIDKVKIKRSLNGTVTLDILERKATYMLKFDNKYVYINNQGYMLEISENPLELPTITGFSTPDEEIKVGNRLNVDDLNKLEEIIKIIETAKNVPLEDKDNTLASIITQIDISNNSNYKLILKSEGKTVELGELKELNVKLGRIAIILKQEKGKKGQIYFQDGIDDKTVFREEVSR